MQCPRQESRGWGEQAEEEPPYGTLRPGVDPAKYPSIKALLAECMQQAQADGLDYGSFIRLMAARYGEPMVPYLLQFHTDLQRPPVP